MASMRNIDPHRVADAIRFLAMDACERVGEGHPGTPLGAAEIATALFTRHLKFNPADPLWFDRDRFVLSAGHGSMLLYALLHLSGYAGVPMEALRTFRELGSACEGHPEYHPERGIEATTGPLGQGIANAAGMAVAEAFLAAQLGPDLVDHRSYAIVGDGCLQEGVAHEVASLAGHLRLGKLTWLWDDNRMTDDGEIGIAQSEDLPARFRAANWQVLEVDGHDVAAVDAALSLARHDARPSFIACRTVIGRGLPGVEGTRAAHSGKLTRALTDAARQARNWPHPPFTLPEDIAAPWRAAARRSLPDYEAWQARVAALPAEKRRHLDRLREGRLPQGWQDGLRAYARQAAEQGLSQHGWKTCGEIVEIAAAAIPEMLAGAPDLEAATQHKRRLSAFTAEDCGGRYLHYGVREHAMGSMLNGMAAHGGVVPSGVTYLVFSDYERPAFRLAAMMGLPVLFAFTHDSIGIGRNGPTHQPVEYLASLRAIPNLLVFRPADAVEAAECWELAIAHRTGPACLVFARQPQPVVRRTAEENLSGRGAYVLAEAEGGERVATILATGTEVALALRAREMLASEGLPVAVVSMPCWELFEQQTRAYRTMVLGQAPRVAVEAAVRLGWDRWIGPEGSFIGMSGFGASGSEDDLWRHFGITAEAVAAAVRQQVGRRG
jgi:transketolase